MPLTPQAAASELVRRGTLTPEQADAKAPGWRLSLGAVPKLEAQERKTLSEAQVGAERAGSVMLDLERFQALNRRQGSGGFLGLPVIRDIHGVVNPDVGEMNSITNRLTPSEREAGSGAMSDKDVEMYRAAVPGQGYMGPTNKNIANRRRAGAIRQKEYKAFLDYFARTNGTLNGAQELWDEYKDADPVYDAEKGEVRQSRGWRQYFGVNGRAAPTPPPVGETVNVGGKTYSVRVKGQ